MSVNFEKVYEGAIEPGKEPKKLFKQCLDGTLVALSYAEILLNKAIKDKGPDCPVAYPDTAYFLPAIRCLGGYEVNKLGELVPILNKFRGQVTHNLTFENILLCGESTIYAAEIIEAVRYATGRSIHPEPWTGFVGDPVVRKYGIKMVDWTIPGEAVIVGRARTSAEAAKMVNSLMGKGLMLFLCDEVIEQLLEENVKLGLDYIAYPLGNFTQVIHAVNYALRAGMMFAGIEPGLRDQHRQYQRDRVLAFVLALGERDIVKVAASFAAIFLGFPVLVDQPLDEDEQIKDWYFSCPDYEEMVQVALEVRGIKVTAIEIDIPINQGPSFEGESIRRKDMYVEFGGQRSTAWELCKMVSADEIEDGKIEVIGPELDEMQEGEAYPLGIYIKIYGRKMQEDFEAVLERRIHYFTNYGEGFWHTAQRDLAWVRISKDAFGKGARLKHLGTLLMAKLKQEFSSIVDRVEINIFTDKDKVEELLQEARANYRKRDERMKGLTDEAVDEFFTCTLCQSFAPSHICIVSPERTGLCGAVNWLDAKATFEIDPVGVCQPINIKEKVIDLEKGEWENVNEVVAERTGNRITEMCLYTMMDRPMTTCGCCEAICAIVPECNGVMITTREHTGMTPVGMSFSTLAGSVGGGQQTPGFVGIGRTYVPSKKFFPADGGLGRLIWMPKELKDELRDEINERGKEEGYGDAFADMIADETVGEGPDEIMPFLEEKGHPALQMDPMM